MHRIHSNILGFLLMLIIGSISNAATVLTVDLAANDIGYSSLSDRFYASIPNSASTDPNTIIPINPNTGALETAIPVGFNPGEIAVSFDGSNVFTVGFGNQGVRRYNVALGATDQLVTVSGMSRITQILAIPDRPNAFLVHLAAPGFSPPALSTVIFENGVQLPDHIGNGLGIGGPDIFAVDATDGTRGYSYVNTNTGFGSAPIVISASGVLQGSGEALTGVMTGFNIGRIERVGDLIFDDRGDIFSLSLGVQVGAFLGGSNFVIDPHLNKFFSVTTQGSAQTIHAYSLSTLSLLGSETLTGINGSTSHLTRFQQSGLAFQTSNGQIVFVHSAVVPEVSVFGLCLLLSTVILCRWTWQRLSA